MVHIDGMHVDLVSSDRMVMLVNGRREADDDLDVLGFCVSTASSAASCWPICDAGAAIAWAARWRESSPVAVRQFMSGLSDSLQFYSLPKAWWSRARTNNPQERLIATLRMRLNAMGCFHNTPAIERAVFGQLLRWPKFKRTHSC